jgi:Domain of unknown function (DUF4337)
MSEDIELPEHEEHEKHPLTIPVSVTMAILAVVGTIVTLLGHRAHTEELLLQAKASDQWNYYQAKDIRLHEMEAVADMVGTLAPLEKERATTVQAKYLKEVDRYRTDKEKIQEEAKGLEAERDVISRRADRFDGGEALVAVGLVICSLTLLTKKRFFWFTGILFGVAGVVTAATGFLLH